MVAHCQLASTITRMSKLQNDKTADESSTERMGGCCWVDKAQVVDLKGRPLGNKLKNRTLLTNCNSFCGRQLIDRALYVVIVDAFPFQTCTEVLLAQQIQCVSKQDLISRHLVSSLRNTTARDTPMTRIFNSWALVWILLSSVYSLTSSFPDFEPMRLKAELVI